jgi:hypothetical protein
MFGQILRELERMEWRGEAYNEKLFRCTVGFGLASDESRENDGKVASLMFAEIKEQKEFLVFMDLLLAMQMETLEAFVKDLTILEFSLLLSYISKAIGEGWRPKNEEMFKQLIILCARKKDDLSKGM